MSKVSARPPLKKEETQQALDDLTRNFIRSGEVIPSQPVESAGLYPWEAEHVRDDVIKSFNVRLPESYFLKFEYISKQTRRSKQSLCVDIVKEVIDAEISKLIN